MWSSYGDVDVDVDGDDDGDDDGGVDCEEEGERPCSISYHSFNICLYIFSLL